MEPEKLPDALKDLDRERAAQPMQVPTAYFDGLTPRIMQAVRASEAQRKEGFSWGRMLGEVTLVRSFGLASVILLAVAAAKQWPVNELPAAPDLAALSHEFTIEEIALFADVSANDLVMNGLLLPDTLGQVGTTTDDDAMQLLLDGGFEPEELIEDINI